MRARGRRRDACQGVSGESEAKGFWKRGTQKVQETEVCEGLMERVGKTANKEGGRGEGGQGGSGVHANACNVCRGHVWTRLHTGGGR